MTKKSLRLAAALMSMAIAFQTAPINALLATPESDAAAIQGNLFDSQTSDVLYDSDTAEPDLSDGDQPEFVSFEGIDFSSRRLLVATDDSSIFTEDTQVLSEYDGIYLLAFADEAETMSAYTYYYEIADFVESDCAVFIADDDYTDADVPVFSDSASDAFTQLNLLLDVDEAAEDDIQDVGHSLLKSIFDNASSRKSDYNVAIIDTGAANGITDSVSVIGGDGVDDNGHGTAMFSAVKSISDDISVLSIKAFDRRGVGKISAIYAAVAYAVRQGVDVINLPFDAESATDSVVLDRAVSMAQRAGITVAYAADNNDVDVYAGINSGIILDKNYVPARAEGFVDNEEEYIDIDDFFPDNIDYEVHDRLIESDSDDHPLLELSELETETTDAINSEPVVIADESDEDKDWSVPPTQPSVTVDNTTIERIHVRWLTTSDGANTPAYFGRLNLDPTSDIVKDQQFQIDFALSGQQAYQPGMIELSFPAYIWLDRNKKEPGKLTLAVPEDPETGVEFVWKRIDDKIVITNTKTLAAASKVMIQGTFCDVAAHDMVDGTVSNKFSVTLTVSTPHGNTATMTSNEIDAQIDTEARVSYANKTAYDSVTGTYDVWWNGVPEDIPEDLLPADKNNYAYVRWYVAGTADGNQPYKMYVEDTIALDEDGEPEYGGILLGVSDIAENEDDTDVKKTEDGVFYKKADSGRTVKALLYDGYSTIVKSAYVWTAYPKNNIPEEKVTLHNTQTISVRGWDDSARCERCRNNLECEGRTDDQDDQDGLGCLECQDCDCTTARKAKATVETKSPTTYTFIKHWSDIVIDDETGEPVDNYWGKRPDELILKIYSKEYSEYSPWRIITLTRESSEDYSDNPDDPNLNNWTYTWSDEGQIRTYSVAETIDESKRKGVFKTRFDDSGHQLEWQYVLRETEYDEETHTWTYTNEYDDGWIKYELSTINKKVEDKYNDSKLDSKKDGLSLNQLLRDKDIYVQYPVTSTISVAKQAFEFDVNPNKFVLEDTEYYFNNNHALTVDDVDISEVIVNAPVVYTYTAEFDEDGYHDREIIDTPLTTLYGKVDGDWIELATFEDNCTTVNPRSGATVAQVSGNSWSVTMPDNKLVSHVKLEFDSDENVATTMADMSYTVTLHVKPTEAVKNMISNAFEEDDLLSFPLYNKATGYAIYLGTEHRTEEDEYGETRSYDNGDTVSTMEDTATGYLHGRQFRVAAELEKSFTFDKEKDIDKDNKRITLHSTLMLTQQSNVTSRSDYDYAIKMGELPNTNAGTYYDLLPVGVDPVISTVKAGGSDSVKNVWTISNYKDSRRTLLIVEVNLVDNISYTSYQKYKDDEDMAKYYPDEGYKNTHTLTFDSYCAYDVNSINNTSMYNVAAYEASEGEIGNITDWTGEPDDPKADNHIQSENAVGTEAIDGGWMAGLNPNSNGEPAFVYAGDEVDISGIDLVSVNSVNKQVSVTGSGEWSKGEDNDVNVQEGGLYSYRLTVSSDTDTTTSDIILLDSIENYVPNETDDIDRPGDYGDNQWHGTLLSIDLSQVDSAGVKPVIYYSEVENLEIFQTTYNPEPTGDTSIKHHLDNDTDQSGKKIWNSVEFENLSTVDLSKVKAIAIDMTTDKDGNPFTLKSGERLIVYLNMRAPYEEDNSAPDYFKNRNNVQTDGTDHTQNAHAYNDIYLSCSQTYSDGENVKESYDYINESYTKVGIYTKSVTVRKEWDDENDADGKRPGKITVKLLDSNGNVVKDKEVELNEENGWEATIERLLTYDEDGNYINYTFEETFTNSDDYTLTVKRAVDKDGGITYTLNNYHEPEKIDIPVTKTWQDDSSATRPSYITVKLYAKYPGSEDKVLVRSIKLEANSGWNGVFEGLNKYYKGALIEYTVEEEPVYDYVPDEPEGNPRKPEEGFTILNKYYPYGNLIVTKNVKNGTGEALKNEFTFTLTLQTQDGRDVINQYNYIIYDSDGNPTGKTGKIGNGGEFVLKDGERIEITGIPTHIKYTVTETSKSGFTLTKTVNDTGEIVSWPDTEAEFTNKYTTDGSAELKALKLLEGRSLLRYQFSFELYEKIGDDYTLLRTVYNDQNGNVSFGQISYTNADDNKAHIYKIVEVNEGKAGYTYDPNSTYYAQVTPHDNGDGTMYCDIKYYSDENLRNEIRINVDGEIYNYPVFQNEYHAEGSISFSAWKVLDGRSVEADEFEFNLYDEEFNLIGTFTNDAGGRVNFKDLDELKYKETDAGKTYWYYAREVEGDDQTVDYDKAVIAYRIGVVDNGDGTLSFNQSSYYVTDALEKCETCDGTGEASGNDCGDCNGFGYTLPDDWDPEDSVVPIFNNGLKDGSLSVSKYTKDGTDPNQKFHFRVKLIGEKVEDGEIEYEITDAEERTFPITDYSETAMAKLMDYADPFSRLSAADIDKDAASDAADGDYPVMPIADGDIASGISVGVSWRIDADGTLILEPAYGGEVGTLASVSSTSAVPWYSYRTRITAIEINKNVNLSTNAQHLFRGCTSLTSVKGLENLDVSRVESMSYMFYGCTGLTSLEGLEGWNVGNVKDMNNMFYNCNKLTSLEGLEGWNVGNVKDMSHMFQNCSQLTSLEGLEGWDVGNVTNMTYMFGGCTFLKSLKSLEGWNVGNVTTTNYMFQNCRALTLLEGLEDWNVGSVVDMNNMFYGCNGLTSIEPIKEWDVHSATIMSYMFYNCQNLEEADLSKWRPSAELSTIGYLFGGCSKLEYVNLSGWGPGNNSVTATNIFASCLKLYTLYLKDWSYNTDAAYSLSGSSRNLSEIQFSETAFNCFTSIPDATWVLKDELMEKEAGGNFERYTTGADLSENGERNKIYVWEDCYTIVFKQGDADGVYGSMGDVTSAPVYGRFDIPNSEIRRADYVLTGWRDEATGDVYYIKDGVATIPARKYASGAKVTLIPVWGEPNIETTEMHDGEFDFWLKGGEKATIKDIPAGTAYQVWEETPDGWVLVQQVDSSGIIEPLETAQAEFYNLYQPDKTAAVIYGLKLFDNKAANADADGNLFEFELVDKENGDPEEDYVIQTVTAQDGGFIQFAAIEYDEEDVGKTFTYIVREKAGGSSRIRYDAREWEVTVTVTRTDEGVMGTTVEYKDITNDTESTGGVRFENTTLPGSLELSKIGEGVTNANKDTMFKFRIKLYNENGMPLTEGSFNWYIRDDATGEIITQNTVDTGSGDEEQDEDEPPAEDDEHEPEEIAVLSADDDYPIMTIAADESESHPVKWSVVDNTLILEPADGNSYGVLPNITDAANALWSEERNNIEYIKINGDVRANKQAEKMFSNLSLKSLEGLANLDVSDVESMASMFSGRDTLTSLAGLETWDVSNVKNMSGMFNDCNSLESVDALKDWNVGKVTNMSIMFQRCNSLTSLADLENWNVSSVTNMDNMFQSCTSLTSLAGLENWNVSSVTSMSGMFNTCNRLASLAALKYWNVSGVTNMYGMFNGCTPLTSLTGLESWDVSGIKSTNDVRDMFMNCTHLETADLREWKFGADIQPTRLFSNCSNLKKLYLDNWRYDGSSSAVFDSSKYIAEIRFSAGAFKSAKLYDPVPETDADGRPYSAGYWVNIKDLKEGPRAIDNGKAFKPDDLQRSGIPGETYVLLSYYNIDFDFEHDEHSSVSNKDREYGSARYDYEIEGVIQSYDGYVFAGWKDETNGNVYPVINDGVTIPAGTYEHGDTIKLTAIWVKADEETKVTYSVEHYLQDIGFDSYTCVTVPHTVTITGEPILAPLLDNYDGFIKPEEKWIIVTDEGEIVVKYYYNRMRYTVHFDGNGADGGSMSDIHMTGGIARALGNGFTKTGYAFLGWSAEPEGDVVYNAFTPYKDIYKDFLDEYEEDAEITLYAKWLKLDQTVEPSQGEIIISCKAGQTIVIDGLPAGTTYEIEEIDVPSSWEIVDESGVSGRIIAGGVSKASVTNKYSAKTTATITAHKMFEGGDLTSGMFDFELWEAGTTQTRSETTWSTLYATGSYKSGQPTMTETEYPVTIPGAKKLHVFMKFYTGSTSASVYVYKGPDSTGELIGEPWNAQKETEGSSNQAECEFEVDGDTVCFLAGYTPQNPVKNRAPAEFWAEVTEVAAPVATATNGTVDNVSESVDFDSGEMVTNPWYGTAPVIFSGLEFTEPGEYHYQIREKIPSSESVYEQADPSHTSAYQDDGTPIAANVNDNGIDDTVTIEGAESLEIKIKYFAPSNPVSIYYGYSDSPDDFELLASLTGTSINAETTYPEPNGDKLKGDTVKFVTNGAKQSHYYAVVTGEIPHDSDIVYDNNVIDVTVRVFDKGDGTLDYEVIYDPDESAALFKNSLAGKLEVSKTLEDADNLTDEIKGTEFDFQIELEDSEGNPLSGEYKYTVYNSDGTENEEKSGTLTVVDGIAAEYISIKHDEKFVIEGLPHGTKYTVTEKDANGFELKDITGDANSTITAGDTSEVKFTNVYNGLARLYLSAKKIFRGGVIGEEMFEFLLTRVNENGQVLDVLQEKVYAGTDGKITFDPIDFDEKDLDGASYKEFFFAITEVNGGLDGVQYDNHIAIIRVILTKDENGDLILATDYGNGSVVSISDTDEPELEFVNDAMFDLDVSKTVTGVGERDRDFNFTLILKHSSSLPDSIGWEKSDIDFGALDVTMSCNESCETCQGEDCDNCQDTCEDCLEFVYEFTLKHGETIKFKGLPYGTDYSIVEEQLDDYNVKVTTSTSGETGETSETDGETAAGTIEANVSVAYINHMSLNLPEAGGSGMRMAGLGSALTLAGLAALLFSRKRRYGRA